MVRNYIDGIVKGILARSDEEFFKYINDEDRWELDIIQNLYAYLSISPSNCFKGLNPAMRYIRNNYDGVVSYRKNAPECFELQVWLTQWKLERKISEKKNPFWISIKMRKRDYWVVYDDRVSVGVILAISYHYPYIQEKAKELILETEKRRMINSIKKSATV